MWHARLSLKLVEILSEFVDVASTIITITLHGTMLRIILCFCLFAVITEEPEFTEIIENVTVPAGNESIIDLSINRGRIISGISPLYPSLVSGRNVKLACSVKNLGSYKVRAP